MCAFKESKSFSVLLHMIVSYGLVIKVVGPVRHTRAPSFLGGWC
jgi:hypothetical protein